MKKNQNGFSIIEILIIIAVIGLIGAVGWIYFNKQNTAEKQNSQTSSLPTKNTQRALIPEDITAKIRDTYTNQYKLVSVGQNTQPQQGEMSIQLTNNSPAYKTAGYNYYTDYNGGSTVYLMAGPVNPTTDSYPRPVDISVRTQISDVFKQFGLTKTGSYGPTDIAEDVYTGQGLICTVETANAQTSSASASCGRIASYKATAIKAKPIAKVIPNVNDSTYLSGLKITDSKVSGYQKAEVGVGGVNGIGGFSALLYRKNNGAWQYFLGTQNDINCSTYNTVDLRNAFKGDACFTNDQTTTVQ